MILPAPIQCDSCGKINSQARTISVWLDRKLDAAGDDVWGIVDLCPGCMARELNVLMDRKSNVTGHHEWLDKVRKVK